MNTRLFIQTCFLLLCIFTLSTSCKKEKVEPELVPITTTGENTMGFYIDGIPVNFKEEYGGFIDPYGVTGGIYEDGIIEIFGSGDTPQGLIDIYFPRDSLNSSNEIIINESIYKFKQIIYRDDSPLGGRAFTCDSLHQGEIKILRLDDHVIAGTFEFDAINAETGKVIHVTDGRFDIQWN